MREEVDRRFVTSDQMKDYEMVDQTLVAMSEFNDGTFDVEVMRFSEIVDSVCNIKGRNNAIVVYTQKQVQWMGKIIDNG